ncbi:MAG: hypothetical protein HQL14_04800 [Candidatus Omnitrophica bacterium]|nr:hypothetical protein [Candidatus Omnitrophota bacterium]
MQILLVVNRKGSKYMRIIVKAHTKLLKERVISLLEKDRGREAFDLLVKKAEVEAYLPPGKELPIRPMVTLVEDELS